MLISPMNMGINNQCLSGHCALLPISLEQGTLSEKKVQFCRWDGTRPLPRYNSEKVYHYRPTLPINGIRRPTLKVHFSTLKVHIGTLKAHISLKIHITFHFCTLGYHPSDITTFFSDSVNAGVRECVLYYLSIGCYTVRQACKK